MQAEFIFIYIKAIIQMPEIIYSIEKFKLSIIQLLSRDLSCLPSMRITVVSVFILLK